MKRATITEKKRRSWNALEKLAIILYQEKVCSVRSAANKFNIQPKQIRDWKKKKERSHFTVVLACMADGTKLPPLIIFKLKNVPRISFPSNVFVRANPSGMDE